MKNTKPDSESLRKQLELVDIRMRHHILRFWGWAMGYISIVFISISKSDVQANLGKINHSYGLALLGILVLVAMYASYEGTMRSINDVLRIEEELGLKNTPKKKPLQFIPFVLIVILGILFSLYNV